MRWIVVLVAGCGRIGFEQTPGGIGLCADASKVHDTQGTAQPLPIGAGSDDVLCPGRPNIYAVALTRGDELVATIAISGSGWPTLALAGERGIRAVETLEPRANAFADVDGTYYVTVSGLPTAAGTPYHLDLALGAGQHVFVAPDGDDANPGTFDQPWRDLDAAATKVRPGTVLIVKDGLFSGGNHSISVDCSVDAMNGLPDQPIRIAALTERGAHIVSDGTSTAAVIRNCSWWTIEGLYLENVDVANLNNPGGLGISASDHIVVRRILATHNNRYTNSHAVTVNTSSNVLVEECEAYDFHRNGFEILNGTGYVARRNFAASRGRADLSGGYISDPSDKGDAGFGSSGTNGAVWENNIDEGNGEFGIYDGYGSDTLGARVLGNIASHDDYGFISSIQDGTPYANRGTRMADVVALDSKYVGFFVRSTEDLACDRCTTIASASSGWIADVLATNPRPASSSCTHCLSIGSTSYGFRVVDQPNGWSITSSNAFGNGTNFGPSTAPELVAATQVDPQLGACLVYGPESSPMRGESIADDTGAQVVFRYVDGALTGTPLWHPITGAFSCGAVVAGVNDDPATSCIGVHQRLHVGTADCALPYAPP